MRRKVLTAVSLLMAAMLCACGSEAAGTAKEDGQTQIEENTVSADAEGKAADDAAALEDGVYEAEFRTESAMFHVNEAKNNKGTLTVADGKMTIHVSLVSKNILNLYPGSAQDAQTDEANVLQPTVDEITYSDGCTEEVYGFDVPVPEIGTEFDLALLGKKGKWYDHKVRVTDPVKTEEGGE